VSNKKKKFASSGLEKDREESHHPIGHVARKKTKEKDKTARTQRKGATEETGGLKKALLTQGRKKWQRQKTVRRRGKEGREICLKRLSPTC